MLLRGEAITNITSPLMISKCAFHSNAINIVVTGFTYYIVKIESTLLQNRTVAILRVFVSLSSMKGIFPNSYLTIIVC